MQQYLRIVQEILSTELLIKSDRVIEDTRFLTDLEMDSLDIMDMIIVIEKRFTISIAEHEIGDLETVGQLIDFIKSKVV
jgi:acyl carrier protein